MTTPKRNDNLSVALEFLYDLNRDELRRLAWEALLISDGPDRIPGEANGPVKVSFHTSETSIMGLTHFRIMCPEEL